MCRRELRLQRHRITTRHSRFAAGLPIVTVMATVRIIVFSAVALLGAVKIREPLGVPGLVVWTAGAMAVSHSRNWRGSFPGEDDRARPCLAPRSASHPRYSAASAA